MTVSTPLDDVLNRATWDEPYATCELSRYRRCLMYPIRTITGSELQDLSGVKPSTVEKLKNTMKSALKNGETETEMAVLIQALQDSGVISVSGGKVTYALPPKKF